MANRWLRDPNVTPLPVKVVGRVLTCHGCNLAVDVLEACQGARTPAEHRWLDADTYVCGPCTMQPALRVAA